MLACKSLFLRIKGTQLSFRKVISNTSVRVSFDVDVIPLLLVSAVLRSSYSNEV